jgi:hypothetical protein
MKPEDPKGDFPDVHKEVDNIFGGPDSYEPKRKEKVIARDSLRSPLPLTAVTTWTLLQS